MGHPEPFDLRYVAIGNEDCGKTKYRGMHPLLYLADNILFFSFHRKLIIVHKGFICCITV